MTKLLELVYPIFLDGLRDSGGTLSVVLAGHPKLKNDLRRPSMEEIGSRATEWLLTQSTASKTKIEGIITEDALATLSEKLSTPLQFEFYLTRALEEAHKVGQKPVEADIMESRLSRPFQEPANP